MFVRHHLVQTFTPQELHIVSKIFSFTSIVRRTLNLARLNVVRDSLGATAINLAASAESSSEDLLDGTLQVLGHRLEPHGAGNVDDLIKRNALGVLNVLLLLAVAGRLLEGLDNERRSGGHDGDGGLTVLDGQLDRDTEAFPVASGLGDIFTDLYAMQELAFCAMRHARSIELWYTYSWARDREDRSWGRVRTRHRLHHRSHEGG